MVSMPGTVLPPAIIIVVAIVIITIITIIIMTLTESATRLAIMRVRQPFEIGVYGDMLGQ
jgi:hypothetical protein